jgi:hypothetical protein
MMAISPCESRLSPTFLLTKKLKCKTSLQLSVDGSVSNCLYMFPYSKSGFHGSVSSLDPPRMPMRKFSDSFADDSKTFDLKIDHPFCFSFILEYISAAPPPVMLERMLSLDPSMILGCEANFRLRERKGRSITS